MEVTTLQKCAVIAIFVHNILIYGLLKFGKKYFLGPRRLPRGVSWKTIKMDRLKLGLCLFLGTIIVFMALAPEGNAWTAFLAAVWMYYFLLMCWIYELFLYHPKPQPEEIITSKYSTTAVRKFKDGNKQWVVIIDINNKD